MPPQDPTHACTECGDLGEQCICERAAELGIHNGAKARERRRRRREASD